MNNALFPQKQAKSSKKKKQRGGMEGKSRVEGRPSPDPWIEVAFEQYPQRKREASSS